MDPAVLVSVLVSRVRYVCACAGLPFKMNVHVPLRDEERFAVAVRRLGHKTKELNWVKGKVHPRTGHEGPEGE
jgi:hypothetical protein